MKNLQFRIWSKKYNSFVQPGESLDLGEIYQRDYNDFVLKLIPREENIIQQFTGVNDKNGRAIFEGDIVRCIQDETEFICEIEPMHGGSFWLKGKMLNDKIDPNGKVSFPLLQTYDKELEVLGNIFENPELLK